MKTPIIYLKSNSLSEVFIAFNPKNLSRVEIEDSKNCHTETYDTKESFDWSLEYDMTENPQAVECTREEFNKAFIEYSNNINNLSKEL